MSKEGATLSTEEEIQKALGNLTDEEGTISKAEGGDDGDGDEDDDEGEKDDDDTNAKVEGEGEGKDDDDGDDDDVSKAQGSDDLEDGDDIEKAIDMHPILKAFDERMARVEEAVIAMRSNSGVVMKGMNEKLNGLRKSMEDVENWSGGRKSMGALPEERFEKAVEGYAELDAIGNKQDILKSIEGQAFDGDKVINRQLADAIVMYESSNTVSKAIQIACAKEKILLKGYNL